LKKKIICFDIDNTICNTINKNYLAGKPKKKIIKIINYFFEKGYIIKLFTSRFMGRNNENVHKAKKQGYSLTKKQLESWGVNYHKLIFGKPSYDLFVDDKSLGFNKNWHLNFKKIKNIVEKNHNSN